MNSSYGSINTQQVKKVSWAGIPYLFIIHNFKSLFLPLIYLWYIPIYRLPVEEKKLVRQLTLILSLFDFLSPATSYLIIWIFYQSILHKENIIKSCTYFFLTFVFRGAAGRREAGRGSQWRGLDARFPGRFFRCYGLCYFFYSPSWYCLLFEYLYFLSFFVLRSKTPGACCSSKDLFDFIYLSKFGRGQINCLSARLSSVIRYSTVINLLGIIIVCLGVIINH